MIRYFSTRDDSVMCEKTCRVVKSLFVFCWRGDEKVKVLEEKHCARSTGPYLSVSETSESLDL